MTDDVVIIGSGPAGAAAAQTLADAGCRITVVERAVLPRVKLCGGAMPTTTWRRWATSAPNIWHASVTRIAMQGPSGAQSPIDLPANMTFVDRAEFDAALMKSACKSKMGRVDLLMGAQATAVCETETHVEIHLADQRRLTPRYLVAADGAVGRTAHQLGIPPLPMAIAITARVHPSPTLQGKFSESPLMDLGAIDGGYGWIFPCPKEGLACGIGTWQPQRGIRAKFNAFIHRYLPGANNRIAHWRTAPIPVFTPGRPLGTRRVCLVGDAAGLVDPVSGEGIHYALLSGQLAANAILEADGGPCQTYAETVSEKIGQRLNHLIGFAQPLFMGAPDRFFEQLTKIGDYHSWFSGIGPD